MFMNTIYIKGPFIFFLGGGGHLIPQTGLKLCVAPIDVKRLLLLEL